MSVRYTRQFKYGDKGSDVEAVGRALARSKTTGVTKLAVFSLFPRRIRRTWGRRKQRDLKRFKRKHGLPVNTVYGRGAHEKLSPFFDARAKKLINAWEPPNAEALARWNKLLYAMKQMHEHSAGYGYGAGHGAPLSKLDWNDLYDCSSSTSKALHYAGMFPSEYAWVSGAIGNNYGKAGKGEYFTVYAHQGHAWIKLNRSRWWRFDTSPYGDPRSPRSGPRLRYLPRWTLGFNARHWAGM